MPNMSDDFDFDFGDLGSNDGFDNNFGNEFDDFTSFETQQPGNKNQPKFGGSNPFSSPQGSNNSRPQTPGNSFDDFGGPSNESANPESDELSNFNQEAPEPSPKKTALKVVGLGVGLIILVFIVLGLISKITSGGSSKDNQNVEGSHNSQQTQQVQQQTPVQSNNNSNVSNDNNGWINFTDSSGLNFEDEKLDSVFTITDVNHYVKIVDSENNLSVKTVLTGSLSGFIGTFELEVPYNKGRLLNKGNHFDVQVQIGSTSAGKTVVGEISY